MRDPIGFTGMSLGRHIRTADGRIFKRHRGDSNKYALPHQGSRECRRRFQQLAKKAGRLDNPLVDVRALV